MKIFADYDAAACFSEKGHLALLSGLGNYSFEEWGPAGVHLTLKRLPLGLRSHLTPNRYFLDTAYYAATIPVTGGDSRENMLYEKRVP
jgi:hypothetical protein